MRVREIFDVAADVRFGSAVAGELQVSPTARLLPDYLLLAFFCVTLYYKERLVFFDLVLKRGVFLAFSLLVLATPLTPGGCRAVAAPGNGHGLRNIAERLSGYYGDSARISWENQAEGTMVRLQIPRRGVAAGAASAGANLK